MTDESFSLYQIVNQDPRYPVEAYWFVRDALAFAADTLELGVESYEDPDLDPEAEAERARRERHLTGQQLCEAIRQYALQQYGFMAQIVLKTWNIDRTGCFGDIVYNMIGVGLMRKSSDDKRSHFDNVYDFKTVFDREFEICDTFAQRRS